MDLGLTDRVAIVTGASRGLGRAEAEALAAEGAAVVVVTAKTTVAADRVSAGIVARGGRSIACQADVTQTGDVERMVRVALDTFDRLDILVNNAGITDREMSNPLVDLTEDWWDRVLASHLRSTFLCMKYAAPHMLNQRWGRIVNTSSIHGRVGGRAGFGHYGAAKAGVIALTQTAAREFGPQGVTVNVVAPGVIATEIVESNLGADKMAALQEQIPLGRLGRAAEISTVVAFLASEAASYLNGAVVDVHGGRCEFVFP